MIRYEIRTLQLDSGECPFEAWLSKLKDVKSKGIVRTRIDRIALGLFGDSRDLKGNLWELKIDFGPGYRVYYGRDAYRIVLLIIGGDKSSQKKDILMARKYWFKFLEEKHK